MADDNAPKSRTTQHEFHGDRTAKKVLAANAQRDKISERVARSNAERMFQRGNDNDPKKAIGGVDPRGKPVIVALDSQTLSKLARVLDVGRGVAKESTQREVAAGVHNVTRGILELSKDITGSYSLPSVEVVDAVNQMREASIQQSKALTVSGKQAEKRTVSVLDRFRNAFLPAFMGKDANMISLLKEIADSTASQLQVMGEWFTADRTAEARRAASDGQKRGPGRMMTRAYRSVIPYGSQSDAVAENVKGMMSNGMSVGRGAIALVSSISNFFIKILGFGKYLTPVLSKLGVNVGAGGGMAASSMLGKAALMVGRVAAFVGTSALFINAIGAIVLGSVVTSLVKTPGMIEGYMKAFGDLWTKSIGPAFEKIGGWVSAWWNGEGSETMQRIGDVINYSLIYVIGTALPAVLNTVGGLLMEVIDLGNSLINTTMDTFKNIFTGFAMVFKNIIGIFGIGSDGDKGLLTNLIGILHGISLALSSPIDFLIRSVASIGIALLNSVDVLVTGVMSLFSLDTLIGMEAGMNFSDFLASKATKIWGALEAMWDGMVNGFWGTVDSVKAYIDEINPIELIKGKIKSLVDVILGIIPSFDDIKKFLYDSAAMVPGGQWLMDRLGSINDTQQKAAVESVNSANRSQQKAAFESASDRVSDMASPSVDAVREVTGDTFEKFVSSNRPAGGAAPVIIYQNNSPVTTTNRNSVIQGGASRGSGRAITAPDLSPWDLRSFGGLQ